MAEAAAARQQAEFDRLLAEKERERREAGAEDERKRQSDRAKFECDKAVLTASKNVAIADAKLKAIEQAIKEEETLDRFPSLNEPADSKQQTQAWVNSQTLETVDCVTNTPNASPIGNDAGSGERGDTRNTQGRVDARLPLNQEEFLANTYDTRHGTFSPRNDFAGNAPIYSPKTTHYHAITPMEELVTNNQRLAASIARQNLPKCHPEVFAGDVTLFHPWKSAFRAIIEDANVSPSQEMNYLRNYTKDEAQKVVNNYRQRQYTDPTVALQGDWAQLERRFGNPAAITNVLLEKLHKTAKFGEGDSDKLQTFADVCADVDSQIDFLPGLGCLNYLTAIGPIVENLPSS